MSRDPAGWSFRPGKTYGNRANQTEGLDSVYLRKVPVQMAESARIPEPEFCDVA